MKKESLLGALAAKGVKEIGKYELAKATGGMLTPALGMVGQGGLANSLQSKPFSIMSQISGTSAKLNGGAGSFGQIRDRNSSPQFQNKVARMNINRLNRTFKAMDLLEKSAANWKDIAIGTAISTAVPMAIGAGIHGAGKLYNHHKSEKTWKSLKEDHPDLNDRDRENFEVLKTFSPNLSHNKTTARSFLERSRNLSMMPHEFVGNLSDIQHKINQDENSSRAGGTNLGGNAFRMGVEMSHKKDQQNKNNQQNNNQQNRQNRNRKPKP